MASSIPAVKAALIALWAAQLPSTVVNGPVVGVGQDAALTVGYQDQNQPIAVDGGLLLEDFRGTRWREQYTVNCALSMQSGSTDVAAGETALFALWTQVLSVLIANFPSLGVSGVQRAAVDRFQYVPSQGQDGLTGTIFFGVLIDANTT